MSIRTLTESISSDYHKKYNVIDSYYLRIEIVKESYSVQRLKMYTGILHWVDWKALLAC